MLKIEIYKFLKFRLILQPKPVQKAPRTELKPYEVRTIENIS